jgi:hypothetical protein
MRACLALGALAVLAGCGAAAPPAAPTSPGGAGEEAEIERIGDVDELERRLAATERQLEAELGDVPIAAEEEPASPQSEPEPPGAAPEPSGSPRADRQRPSACEVACRALGSMRRSADRICQLTSADGPRCSSGRARVARAEHRVARAGCECSD